MLCVWSDASRGFLSVCFLFFHVIFASLTYIILISEALIEECMIFISASASCTWRPVHTLISFQCGDPGKKQFLGEEIKKKQSTIMTVHNLCIIPMGFPCCHVSLISSFSSRSEKLICLGAGREIKCKD